MLLDQLTLQLVNDALSKTVCTRCVLFETLSPTHECLFVLWGLEQLSTIVTHQSGLALLYG